MGTVCVACKIANGLTIGEFKINGTALRLQELRQKALAGQPEPLTGMPGGYMLTDGVDADVWDKWWNDHQDSEMVKRNMVFADANKVTVINKARGLRNSASGMTQMTIPAPSEKRGAINAGITRDPRLG